MQSVGLADSDHLGELRRLLVGNPTMTSTNRNPRSTTTNIPPTGTSSFTTIGGSKSMGPPLATRLAGGRPPLGPDPTNCQQPPPPVGPVAGLTSFQNHHAPLEWQQQPNGLPYPFIHPLVPRPQGSGSWVQYQQQGQTMVTRAQRQPRQELPLHQAQQQQQQQQQTRQTRESSFASTGERRAKRGKPTARRSLQAMFDAATEDLSCFSFDSAVSAEDMVHDNNNNKDKQQQDEEGSEYDNGYLCSSQNSGESTFTGVLPPSSSKKEGGLPGPEKLAKRSTQAGADVLMSQRGPATPQPRDALAPSESSVTVMPLMQLLMSQRAAQLDLDEVKAIIYKVTSDLANFHNNNVIHRYVCLTSISLLCHNGIGAATLDRHPHSVHLPSSSIARHHWGPKLQGTDSFAPPEALHCTADRCVHSAAGDMWSLGVLLFALLAGGHLPFGPEGLKQNSALLPNMPHLIEVGMDKFQKWAEAHIAHQMEVINQLTEAQNSQAPPAEGAPVQVDGGTESGMRVLGFNEQATSLLRSLLRADPAQRITAERMLLHPFFSEVLGRLPSLPTSPIESDIATLITSPPPPTAAGGGIDANKSIKTVIASDGDARTIDTTTTTATSDSDKYVTCVSMDTPGSVCETETSSLIEEAETQRRHAQPSDGGYTSRRASNRNNSKSFHTEGSVTGPLSAVDGSNCVRAVGDSNRDNKQLVGPNQAADLVTATGNLPASCYTVIGHVSCPVEVVLEDGQTVTVSALHAVFNVPGKGPMMSAEPVGYTEQNTAGHAVHHHHHHHHQQQVSVVRQVSKQQHGASSSSALKSFGVQEDGTINALPQTGSLLNRLMHHNKS